VRVRMRTAPHRLAGPAPSGCMSSAPRWPPMTKTLPMPGADSKGAWSNATP